MKIRFYGKFSELFRDLTLAGTNPQVLFTGIQCRHPEFKRMMIKHKGQYVIEGDELHIFPDGEGAQFIPLALSIFSAVGAVFSVGVAINQKMIQKRNKRKMGRESESYLFDGIINTDTQGGAVPLAFGHAFLGTTVINNELDAY